MEDGELSCDNIAIPNEIREEGMTDEMLGDMLCLIAEDFINHNTVLIQEV